MADLEPAAELEQPSAPPRSLAGREPAAERAQPTPVTRSLADIEAEGGTEFEARHCCLQAFLLNLLFHVLELIAILDVPLQLKMLLKPSTAASMGACPFPMEQVDSENPKSEDDPKVRPTPQTPGLSLQEVPQKLLKQIPRNCRCSSSPSTSNIIQRIRRNCWSGLLGSSSPRSKSQAAVKPKLMSQKVLSLKRGSAKNKRPKPRSWQAMERP